MCSSDLEHQPAQQSGFQTAESAARRPPAARPQTDSTAYLHSVNGSHSPDTSRPTAVPDPFRCNHRCRHTRRYPASVAPSVRRRRGLPAAVRQLCSTLRATGPQGTHQSPAAAAADQSDPAINAAAVSRDQRPVKTAAPADSDAAAERHRSDWLEHPAGRQRESRDAQSAEMPNADDRHLSAAAPAVSVQVLPNAPSHPRQSSAAVSIGANAGSSLQGQYAVAIGCNAGTNNQSQSGIAIGVSAMAANTTGGKNVAVGSSALASNTFGDRNNAFGYLALYSNTTGSYNVGIGYQALYSNITGTDNVAVGYRAGNAILSGVDNTIVGSNAASVSTGSQNTIMGKGSMYRATTAIQCTSIGKDALVNLTTEIGRAHV